MRISKDSKLGVALKVLRAIPMKANDVGIDTYSNCREQGFFITEYLGSWDNRRSVSFTENRNSDHIIVQYGKRSDFDDYGVISEELYGKRKKYFDPDDHEKAAKFIAKWLLRKNKLDS